jgi:fatty-acyl-CoA synthase
MRGMMMDFPLTLVPILERAGKLFGKTEVVSRRPDRTIVRTTYAEIYRRARRLARAFELAGLKAGDRVATLMWNHAAHLEAYLGVPVCGGVLHTLNLRLHAGELAYIANHARDRFLIVDDVLLPVLESFRAKVNFERVFVTGFGGCDVKAAGWESYEEFLAGAPSISALVSTSDISASVSTDDISASVSTDDNFTYPAIDENDAAAMCYTSGTTGKSKGVVYSHRAIVLHSFAQCIGGGFGIRNDDAILSASSMFHANAWGVPFTAAMVGAKLVLPGSHLGPDELLELIQNEKVTLACGVPTVWINLVHALEKNPGRWKLAEPLRIVCGGSAVPEGLLRRLDKVGIQMTHLWGMTETTPFATTSYVKSTLGDCCADEKYEIRAKQGLPSPFVEMRVMRPEGEAPWDGESFGELEVRGPWVAASYFEAPETRNRWSEDGWFRTGDMATIDEEGYVKIVDRSKDMIKSGGEWISSVDLENALMGHAAVLEAAVVGVPHPKWQERPLAVVVLNPGAAATPAELREFLAAKFAKWQLPDAFVFVKEIPRTSVGKFLKSKMREQYANWNWEAGASGG